MNALLCLPLVQLLHLVPAGPEPDALALFRQWSRSPSAELRIQAARSLRNREGKVFRAALLSLLADENVAVRAAVRGEILLRPPAEGPELGQEIAALRDARARVEGLRAVLARREDPTLFAADRDPEVRARAVASGRLALPEVTAALRDPDGRVRALALESVHDPATAPATAADRAEEVRIAATRVADDAGTVAALLGDRSWRVRLAATAACDRVRDAGVVPALIRVLDGEPGRVRARAGAALEGLTGAPFGEDAARWRAWWERSRATFRPVEVRPPRPPDETSSVVRFRRIPIVSQRICFVIDASRSMLEPAPGKEGRTRWQLVVEDLQEVLRRVPDSARFNVILFRTDVEAWKPGLVPASRANRAACQRWIGEAKPAGWTNLFDALRLALSDDDVDALYVLTDGVPSRGAETTRRDILDEIAFLNRYRLVQINCVQAGSSEGLGKRWDGFLDELANAHEGVSVRE
jgi:hypothetical protein